MAVLRTVRAKLTTLVALSAIAALAALPLLHWLMTRQLVDVVDDRVPDAIRGFELELDDDVKDLGVGVHALADSEDLAKALAAKDSDKAAAELRIWHETYPNIGLVAFAADGTRVADAGLPSKEARQVVPGKDTLLAGAAEYRTLRRKGCADLPDPRPAYAVVRRVRQAGFVMACMTFDEAYLANSTEKLGVQLAVTDADGKLAFTSASFPRAALAVWKGGSDLAEADGRAWAIRSFVPKLFVADAKKLNVMAALDVTEIKTIVQRNLLIAAAALMASALAAMLVGSRLARIMSRALGRINLALKKLEQAEYVHVSGVKTGDEIEDLASGFNTMVDGLRERDKLRTTFGKYMTQTVMEHLLKGKVELGGESLKVTILFTDIRSFTTISESMAAQDLVGLLNEYFTEMVTIVMQEGGVVDKYIGDAIMAVFGAPVPKPEDAQNAVRAAVRMRVALVKLNERLKASGRPTLATGIGIHTGEVVAGNIGSEARMEYTVIGDAVNLASRLEGATKDLGVHVLISEDTHALLDSEFDTRPIRSITVKGRAQPVMTYEVVGARQDAPGAVA
jgi:adenylate cyclase